MLLAAPALAWALAPPAPAADPRPEDVRFFEARVRPVLAEKCYGCHGPRKQKAQLRLDSAEGLKKGGDSGRPLLAPGKPGESLLLLAVRHAEGVERMPPKGRLKDSEIADLAEWVGRGAPFPAAAQAAGPEPREHWAFRTVVRPAAPAVKDSSWPKSDLDRFVLAKLEAAGLRPPPPADRRTLIRRATFDLTGLPPAPQEVDAFLKDDSPEAFAKVVDRLLASPAYGERWGRHWLDVARYADTAGDNSDHPLPHAWRYRNWVIDAFNRDLPYDEFIRQQIAGDLLAAGEAPDEYARRVVATGFLALARRFDHDSDKSMHLTYEDCIDTLGKSLLGLTLGCARCHDHKYDAVTARDYYALYGILASSRFSFAGCEAKQQPRDLVPLQPPAEWDRVVKPHRDRLAKLDAEVRENGAAALKHARALQAALAKYRAVLGSGEIPDGGEQKFDKLTGEVAVKAGELLMLSVTPLKNHGADTTLVEWDIAEVGGAGLRWSATGDLAGDLLAGNPHADTHGNKQVWWFLDARQPPTLLPESVRDVSGKPGLAAWRSGDTPSLLANSSKEPVSAWTKLPPRSLFVHPAPDGNVAIGWLSPITGKVRVTGRVKDAHPGGPDGVGWVLEHFATDVRADLLALAKHAEGRRALERKRAELVRAAPRQEVAFAVVEGKPADARVHLRGDPEKLGNTVPRRWLEVLGGQPITTKAGSGRLDLANWVASKDNPLTARVMANRIWLHHFGKGLVKTPNDFGTRGTPPTHPELLDWLAAEFVAKGWSVKHLHRTIMLSSTYRQASAPREGAARIDANNDLYWRFDHRRLSAEELRDSLLVASGKLDRTPGGAHPFPPEASWGFTQHAPFGNFYETEKRSIYLVQVRNRRHPFLGLFDGADPNATTPQRQTTTVPTQALYFLNDPFFHAQAERLAGRALAKPEAGRLDEIFRVALQRSASKQDRDFATAFLRRYADGLPDLPAADRAKAAWAALARVLLASNEFLFLE
jgi:mono/diheme cytochrome c family protein